MGSGPSATVMKDDQVEDVWSSCGYLLGFLPGDWGPDCPYEDISP